MIDTQDLMQQLDLESVISYYAGTTFKHHKCSCPFHTDRTPSLSVKGNRFKCFSCDASGSAIDFVRQYFGLSFIEAVNKLSHDFNLGIATDSRNERPDLWDDLQLEIAAKRRAEITMKIDELVNETRRLADKHRMLFQAGDDEAADEVANQIERTNDAIDFLMNCKG